MLSRLAGGDGAAVATLVASAAVVGWPVIAGGYATYLDNPAHMAEVYAAAFEAHNGWSEVAFCGFPIGTLHSPLWYGLLGQLVRAGVPAGAAYALFVLLGFTAPALALFAVARRCTSTVGAAALSYLLLVQRPAIVGVGSAFGGMWTFYLSAAALIGLVDRLSRPATSPRGVALVAGLLGLTALTHLYALVPLALLALIHPWLTLGRRADGGRRLAADALGGLLGVVAAAAYWGPLVLSRHTVDIAPQHLSAPMVVARLATPTSVLELVNGVYPRWGAGAVVEALPMVVLLALGGAGALSMRRRRDDSPLYGALVAATLLLILLFFTTEFDTALLGPSSWRMLYFVRVGLALAAIPLVARWAPAGWNGTNRWRHLVLIAAALGWAWYGGKPLRDATPDPRGESVAEVNALWEWLEDNHTPDWGRVYLQDTFERPRRDAPLSQSHILALTAHHTGVRQVGATYGVAPYRTASWTSSEFNMVYRETVTGERDLAPVTSRMRLSNATHLVASDGRTAGVLGASERFEQLYAHGRFAVFRAVEVENQWASPAGAGVEVVSARFQTGRYRLGVRSRGPGDVLVKSSSHPGWRVSGAPGATIRTGPSGLIRLEGLPAGESDVSLTFRRERWPLALSGLGWVAIASLFLFLRKNVAA